SDLQTKLQQYAQQEQQSYQEAQQIRPPGPLRAIHQNLVDAIELRYKGLAGLSQVLSAPDAVAAKNQTITSSRLVAQGQLLTASDVVWEQLYRGPATQQLTSEGVKGVVIPSSTFVSNPDVVSARAFPIVLTQGSDLSTSTATTVKVSIDLSFLVTVEDSGDFQEVNVPVTLTIDFGSGTPIKKVDHITTIQAGQRQTVTFNGFTLPTSAFGNKATVKVEVAPVAGEINTSNNSATYTVFFTLS